MYIEVTGYPIPFDIDRDVHGFSLSHDMIRSKLYSDNALVSSISRTIVNSQEVNLVTVPSNSPSKDCRLGWLYTAGLFSLTSMYYGFVEDFYIAWLRNVRDGQASSGAFPNVAPRAVDYSDADPVGGSAPIIITYNLFRMYGSLQTVRENYESLERWMKYVGEANPDFLFTNKTGNNYGDFGNVNAETPKEVVGTAFYAHSADLMSKLANALGKKNDVDYYTQLYKNISSAFIKTYVAKDGKIKGDTQTAYILPLAFKILPDDLVKKAVDHLVSDIKAKDHHLSTGYAGNFQ